MICFILSLKGELVNYTDDNTVATVQPTQKLVVDLLQAESRVAIAWFTLNQILTNPEKFQAILINCVENDIEIEIDGIKLSSEDDVKLLGVNLDFGILKFIFNKFVLKPEITKMY